MRWPWRRRRPRPVIRISSPAESRIADRYDRIAREVRALNDEYERMGGIAPDSLVGAGQRVMNGQATLLRRLIMPWQIRSFGYYDMVPEIKYAAQFYSRSLANLRLYVAKRAPNGDLEEVGGVDDDGNQKQVSDSDRKALDALDKVRDPGGGGRSGLLSSYGRLMFLVGETYLFVTQNDRTGKEQWEMLSTEEIRLNDGLYTRFKAPSLPASQFMPAPDDSYEVYARSSQDDGSRYRDAVEGTQWEGGQLSAWDATSASENSAIAYRLWRRHPRFSDLSDATMQGVLELCEELVLLTQAVRARARSRLAGSGVLFFDDRISPVPLEPTPDEDMLVDPFFAALTATMTAPIVDEGTAAAVVPLLARVRVPDGMKLTDMIYHLQIIDPMQVYPETGLRMECIKRIAIGLDMPSDILLGITDANHWCQTDDTEILARGRGWIDQADLTVGDEVYTLNHETGDGEWQPVEDIYRAAVTDEPMYGLESRSHSSLSTPAHRWPIVKTGLRVSDRRRWTTSADGFAPGDRVPLAAPLDRADTDPIYDDEFVRLAVAYTADGTRQEHDNIRIVKFDSREGAEMERMLTAPYGADGFRVHDHPTSTGTGTAFVLRQAEARPVLAVCGDHKALTLDFVDALTHEQRLLMLRSCIEIGDGVERDGAVTLYQSRPERLDAFAYAAHLCGFKVTYGRRLEQTGFGTTPLSWIRWSTANTTFAPSRCKETLQAYTGTIWCPVTRNKTWFARRNGRAYFTGNTAWMVDEQSWKAHLQPVSMQLVEDLTSAYLGPFLQEAGVADWDVYVVAYDETAIVNHPDRGKDANDAHDRGTLSDSSYREAKGFDENDAPSDEEQMRWLGVKMRDPSLAVYGVPSLRSGSEIEPSADTLVGPDGAVVVPGGDSETAAEVEKATPDTKPAEPLPEDVLGSATSMLIARIEGAALTGMLRAREAAGAKIRTTARRDDDAIGLIDKVPNRNVASTLGTARVRALIGGAREATLLSGVHVLITDSMRMAGLPADDGVAEQIADTVSGHALRTLYDPQPSLSAAFPDYVRGLLTPTR